MTHAITQLQKRIAHVKEQRIFAQAPLFLDLLATSLARTQPIIMVCNDGKSLNKHLKNINFFLQGRDCRIQRIPFDDRSVMHATSADPLLRAEKMATYFSIACGTVPDILLLSAESLIERIPNEADLQKHAQLLVCGDSIDRSRLIGGLQLLGYSRVNTVLDRGTFAVRGSVIDVFSNGDPHPVRIDLFGDQIESIKYFDENSQRSIRAIDSITIGAVKEIILDDQTISCALQKLRDLADSLNYPTVKLNEKLRDITNGIHFYGIEKLLPAFYESLSHILALLNTACTSSTQPLILFEDKDAVLARMRATYEERAQLYQQALLRNDLIFFPDNYFLDPDDIKTYFAQFPSIDVASLTHTPDSQLLSCRDTTHIRQEILNASMVKTKDETPHLLQPLASEIKRLHADNITTFISVSSFEHERELKQLLSPFGIHIERYKNFSLSDFTEKNCYAAHVHAYTVLSETPLAYGGIFNFLNTAVIAQDDIFGKRTRRVAASGKQKGFSTSISDLKINDFVVHVDHGVGQFSGLVRLNVRGIENDYILLSYANQEKLYVPVHKITLIKPHGVSKDGTVRLDKLGGAAWVSKKKKVKAAVMAMAQDLLKLYAQREVVERTPCIAPDAHFVEFESNFEFETTQDQQKAIDDVIADLQKKQPMDRLVCGDVGYGKTEVAMRAAMLAVLSNRQVALLAPTTVLAQQHGLTFRERFKNTGVTIAVISRFQKAHEIRAVLHDVKHNKVDIVIGTHRLLSPDVQFHNLGLIVVDEEQRFGIKSKEHLKQMRTKVDVLTMSATPIPRTMQMSYFGIRDLSIIETPPVDRRAIQTQVVQFDDAVIKEAILRELSRGGQVYFVHNRVQTIETIKAYLSELVPEARMAVAHGQMGEKELESVMLKFMSREINVLVCTTIIETGIDVPTANTMFINDADDFGLSQLYQLRGRIGRSKERAFAYLLIKQKSEFLTPIARTRLEILHKFSELGAGFRIAQHDLELRGAGDLLGKNQHGHMAAVGYDLYSELLQDAVKELKGQILDDVVDPEVLLPISALIPEKYCPDLAERMAFYQRLASANSNEAIKSIIASIEDLYGEAPQEVIALQMSAQIKLLLKDIRALKIEITRGKDESTLLVAISLSPSAPIDHQKLVSTIKDNRDMRITPQQKVIQTIPISEADEHAALYSASKKAITQIRAELLLEPADHNAN